MTELYSWPVYVMFKYIYRWPISRYEGFASNLGYLLRKPYSLQVFVYPVIRTVIIKSVSIDQEKYAGLYSECVCVLVSPKSRFTAVRFVCSLQ